MGAQPRPSSGRLRHSEAVMAFGGLGLRAVAVPCMGRSLRAPNVGRPEFLLLISQWEGGALTLPILKSVVPETSAPLRSATPSENRWWPANISSSSSEVAGRSAFRALSPASESRVPHAETPRPANGLSPRGCPRAPVSRVRRSIRRTGSARRSERPFSGPMPGGLCGSVRGLSRGRSVAHFENRL